ncbi:SEC-C metal-binding domain-containing protein [Bacillus sp. JJ1764]|uniref:SEC-C metal-binding domain-containing protein n=1 Tax=Bacillus sp. JJ1764 TaxID=3122964 RepID=UPI002FFD7F7D
MGKIGRNEPCPCGSGKKYKNCCGANEAIPITHLLEGDIDQLQQQLIHFGLNHFDIEIAEDFERFEEIIDSELMDEEEVNFYSMMHAVWFILFVPLEDGKTIIEKFIAAESGKIKRTKLRQILQTWTDARTIVGRLVHIVNNELTLEDGFTGEQVKAIHTGVQTPLAEGSFIIGILVPFEQNYAFCPAPFDLPDFEPEKAFSYIEGRSQAAGYDSPQEYLSEFFIDTLNELPMIDGMVDVNELEWPSPVFQEVAEIFKAKLQSLNVQAPIIDTGLVLWFTYSQKGKKRIQNPHLYAASLHYLLSHFVPMDRFFSQKELGEMYGVKAASISSTYSTLETALSEDMEKMVSIIKGEAEPLAETATVIDFPTRNAKPAPKKKTKKGSRRDEEQAQSLIFEALQAHGQRRYQLAQEALELNPQCVDGYVILAENADDLLDASLMFREGMHIGQQALGKEFFEENKGSFWGLVETRPFMRAKFHYADSLYMLGMLDQAIGEFEELLELNPMDNLGVRDTLFVAYVSNKVLKKAHHLLEQYEGSMNCESYDKLLLELLENGFTVKAKSLLKEAKKENQYVIPYLSGKKKLPKQMPDYHGFGDENQAIIYFDSTFHLWQEIEGLQKWLKEK